MIKRFLAAAALVGLTAANGAAQTHFRFDGPEATTGNWNSMKGTFIAGTPLIGGANGFNLNQQFSVWCVDQLNNVHVAPTPAYYNVVVNRMDGTLGGSRLGATGTTTYQKAAYLANTMGGDVDNSQYAIWAVIHGKAAGSECTNAYNSGTNTWSGGPMTNCVGGTVAGLVTDAGFNYTDINTSEWFVISGQNDLAVPGHSGDGSMQELIARCVPDVASNFPPGTTPPVRGSLPCDGWNPPQEDPTPEPATMSLLAMGLAGMAGNTLRRRKK